VNQKIKQFIDRQRPITQMPGYGMVDLTKYIPTDEEVYINMLEYMSYWTSYWMIFDMPSNKFCELVKLYKQKTSSSILNDIDVRQYKHILVEKINTNFYSRNLKDEDAMNTKGYWYQDILDWCKTNTEGKKLLRELKLERILL